VRRALLSDRHGQPQQQAAESGGGKKRFHAGCLSRFVGADFCLDANPFGLRRPTTG
jgi:hypothetical protein